MTQKNLYIRCDEKTYKLAHAMAKKDNRSLNRELIHIINMVAEEMDIVIDEEDNPFETNEKYLGITPDNADLYVQEDEDDYSESVSTESGLQKLSEIRRSDSVD